MSYFTEPPKHSQPHADARNTQNIGNYSTPERLSIRCAASIPIKPVLWLWQSRIALSKTTILAGDGGLGKSQISAYMASIVSRESSVWPDGAPCDITGNVLILSAEDDAQDTIVPRLMAAGANINRCFVIDAVTKTTRGKITERQFDLTKDIVRLENAIESMGDVKLIIIDPISAYMGKTDSHNNEAVRGMLTPISALAIKHQVAVLLVTHLNKSKDPNPMARVIGSIGLVAAARAGYIVQKDAEQPEKRYFLPIKNNVGNDKDGFSFEIEAYTIDETISTSRVRWHPDLVIAKKILQPEPETQTNGAKAYLENLLSEGFLPAQQIFDLAEGMGYSKSSIQRAANALKINKRKFGFNPSVWFWSLSPLEGIEDSEEFKQMMPQSSLLPDDNAS